jgi:Protein of unknown function (DUF4230)
MGILSKSNLYFNIRSISVTAFSSLKQMIKGTVDRSVDKVIRIGLAVIAAVLVAVAGFNFLTTHAISITTTSQVKDLIVGGVKNASDFTTATIKSKASIVAKQDKIIFRVPVGNTNLVYEGVGTIRAGIDLTTLEVLELDAPQARIHIQLPPPYINEVSLQVDESRILANYRNWFGPKAGAELYDQAQKEARAKIKEEACANDILKAANSNAEQSINTILTKAGFKEIQIDTQQPQPNACFVA